MIAKWHMPDKIICHITDKGRKGKEIG